MLVVKSSISMKLQIINRLRFQGANRIMCVLILLLFSIVLKQISYRYNNFLLPFTHDNFRTVYVAVKTQYMYELFILIMVLQLRRNTTILSLYSETSNIISSNNFLGENQHWTIIFANTYPLLMNPDIDGNSGVRISEFCLQLLV